MCSFVMCAKTVPFKLSSKVNASNLTGIYIDETRADQVTYRISRFVSKFDLEVPRDNNVPWHYVIEIYESEHAFFPRVFRWESFLITPTETDLEICEEKMLVKDEFFDWDCIVGENENSVKNSVIDAIKEQMGLE